jgi:hypothetical protein
MLIERMSARCTGFPKPVRVGYKGSESGYPRANSSPRFPTSAHAASGVYERNVTMCGESVPEQINRGDDAVRVFDRTGQRKGKCG